MVRFLRINGHFRFFTDCVLRHLSPICLPWVSYHWIYLIQFLGEDTSSCLGHASQVRLMAAAMGCVRFGGLEKILTSGITGLVLHFAASLVTDEKCSKELATRTCSRINFVMSPLQNMLTITISCRIVLFLGVWVSQCCRLNEIPRLFAVSSLKCQTKQWTDFTFRFVTFLCLGHSYLCRRTKTPR